MTRVVGFTRPFPGDEPGADEAVLRAAGARRVLRAPTSDAGRSNPASAGIADLGVSDVLLVTSGARLTDTFSRFVSTVADLSERGVKLQVLDEPALYTLGGVPADPAEVFAALERVRREIIGVRTREGMAARAAAGSGRGPGRPPVLTGDRLAMARELQGFGRSVSHIARVLNVSPGTVRRALFPSPPPPSSSSSGPVT